MADPRGGRRCSGIRLGVSVEKPGYDLWREHGDRTAQRCEGWIGRGGRWRPPPHSGSNSYDPARWISSDTLLLLMRKDFRRALTSFVSLSVLGFRGFADSLQPRSPYCESAVWTGMGRWRSIQSAAGIDARIITGHRTEVTAVSPTAME